MACSVCSRLADFDSQWSSPSSLTKVTGLPATLSAASICSLCSIGTTVSSLPWIKKDRNCGIGGVMQGRNLVHLGIVVIVDTQEAVPEAQGNCVGIVFPFANPMHELAWIGDRRIRHGAKTWRQGMTMGTMTPIRQACTVSAVSASMRWADHSGSAIAISQIDFQTSSKNSKGSILSG